jgi:hypothetical protein
MSKTNYNSYEPRRGAMIIERIIPSFQNPEGVAISHQIELVVPHKILNKKGTK